MLGAGEEPGAVGLLLDAGDDAGPPLGAEGLIRAAGEGPEAVLLLEAGEGPAAKLLLLEAGEGPAARLLLRPGDGAGELLGPGDNTAAFNPSDDAGPLLAAGEELAAPGLPFGADGGEPPLGAGDGPETGLLMRAGDPPYEGPLGKPSLVSAAGFPLPVIAPPLPERLELLPAKPAPPDPPAPDPGPLLPAPAGIAAGTFAGIAAGTFGAPTEQGQSCVDSPGAPGGPAPPAVPSVPGSPGVPLSPVNN